VSEDDVRQKTLGVIGLGAMGYGAAINALRRGMSTWSLGLNPDAHARYAALTGIPLPASAAEKEAE
jgi:3-hydroxyisobutyrate dehydrogenase-like beta-hydroxyacid dehydrogenase